VSTLTRSNAAGDGDAAEPALLDYLRERSTARRLTDGKEYALVPLAAVAEAAESYGLTITEVEVSALQVGLAPARYAQNIPDLGFEGQLKLLRACVAVVGTGGIGGLVCELLARAGLGRITVIDGDTFDETNLNRQVLCAERDVGRPKAEVAAERILAVNSGVSVQRFTEFATEANMRDMLRGANVAIDCVDSGKTRLVMQKACESLGIPMVHGTLGGFVGRVMTVMPGDAGMRVFYDREEDVTGERPDRQVRSRTPPTGSPGMTSAAIAPWQVAEAVKLITGKGRTLRNQMLVLDLLNANAGVFPLAMARVGRFINKLRGMG
jgi:molybdopterin/thiamine biosynthesis adenylyltransferase